MCFTTYINAIYAGNIKNDAATEMPKAIFPSPSTYHLNNLNNNDYHKATYYIWRVDYVVIQ